MATLPSRLTFILCCAATVSSCSHLNQNSIPLNMPVKQATHTGVSLLRQGKYQTARRYFNIGLRQNIQSCSLNFLNALSYHLDGKNNNMRFLGEAQAGYSNAIKFCPNDPWPHYYSGIIYYQQKNFRRADLQFKLAYNKLKNNKKNLTTSFLKAYLKSAYFSGDILGGKEAIAMLNKLKPGNKLVTDLNRFYKELKSPSAKYKTNYFGKKSQKHFHNKEKQCVVDAVVLASEEEEIKKRGINLLTGLKAQYGSGDDLTSSAATFKTTYEPGSNSYENSIQNTFSFFSLKYDLNIFNNYDELDEILARPSIVIKDGGEGKFFSGKKLILGIPGDDTGSISEFPLGVHMDISPTFKDNDSVDLTIKIGRDNLSPYPQNLTTFTQAAETTNDSTETTVNLHYNQTLILSTFALNLASKYVDKTPVFGDLPILKTFFNSKSMKKEQTSLLFLITPRRFNAFHSSFTVPSPEALHHYYRGLISPNSNLKYLFNKLRILGIYHFPDRLAKELYDPITFNRAITHEYQNSTME